MRGLSSDWEAGSSVVELGEEEHLVAANEMAVLAHLVAHLQWVEEEGEGGEVVVLGPGKVQQQRWWRRQQQQKQ